MPNDARVTREYLHDLVMRDCLTEALAFARTLPEDDPLRQEFEALGKHALSRDAYEKHYRDVMQGDPCPEGDIFTRHLLVKRFAGIREHVLARKQMRVLDLGCLDGWCLLNLAAGGVSGVGVDLNPQALEVARTRAQKYGFHLLFLESSIEDFDMIHLAPEGFETFQFDAVLLSEVLEHVLDPVACFRTAFRHLAPGGIVYTSTPATSIPHHGKVADAVLHLRVFTDEELRKAAREAGLAAVVDHEIIEQDDQGQQYAQRLTSFRRARVAIRTNHVTGGWDPTDLGSLNASEEMVVRTAEAWARAGHAVYVHLNPAQKFLDEACGACGKAGDDGGIWEHNGVWYRTREAPLVEDGELDVLVLFKTLERSDHPARVKIFWTCDLPEFQGGGAAYLPPLVAERLDKVICISEWHRQKVIDACPWVPPEKIVAHWVGVDPAEITAARHAVPTPERYRVVHASSPDRGLRNLLLAWPRVLKQVPKAELEVLYGFDFWKRSEAVLQEPVRSQMVAARQELERLLQQPGVRFVGRLADRAEYLKHLAAAEVWAYPCTGGELCCKVALEAQALGVIPVIWPTMALQETVMDARFHVSGSDLNVFADRLAGALMHAETAREMLAETSSQVPSWQKVADFMWAQVAEKLETSIQFAAVPKPAEDAKPDLPERFAVPRPRKIGRHKLDLLMHVNGMPFDGQTDRVKSLGGSETAALQLSRVLANRGHHVTIFSNCEQAGKFDGVTYIPLGEYPRYVGCTPHDVCVVQRDPIPFNMPTASKLNVLWMHDLGLHRHGARVRSSLWNVDYVIPVSHWHGRQLCRVYGLEPDVVAPMRNGIERDRVRPKGLHEGPRNRKALVYAARPERGLDLLLEKVFPRLLERDPELVLHIAGYDNTVPEMQAFYNHCWNLAAGYGERVKRVGALTKDQLYQLYRASRAYIYPTKSFEEVAPVRGDSLVDTPAGKFSITSLVGRSGFLAYAYDELAGHITLARVKGVKRTRANTRMITIRYKHGRGCKALQEGELTLTPDHEVMLRDGTYIPAVQLRPGDRVMPFNRNKAGGTYRTKAGRVPLKYTRIHLNDGRLVPEAKFCLEWKLDRPLQPGEHVDHIDRDVGNNDPSNLQAVQGHRGHRKAHIERMAPEERVADRQRRVGYLHAYHASLTPRQMRRVKRRAALAGWAHRLRAISAVCGDCGGVCSKRRCRRCHLAFANRVRWERYRAALNHVVVSVTPAPNADGYCMELEPHHSFVANGIVVHNCISLMECAAAGLPFVGSAWGALPETAACCEGAARLVPHPGEPTDQYVKDFVEAAREVISDDLVNARMSQAGIRGAKVYDWDGVAREWEDFLLGAIELRSADPVRLARHCWRIGDSHFAKHLLADSEVAEDFPLTPDLQQAREELFRPDAPMPPDEPASGMPPSVMNALASAVAQGKPVSLKPLVQQSAGIAQQLAGAMGLRYLLPDDPELPDVVLGVETLDCAPEPDRHIREAELAVKPGGVVCLVIAGPAVQRHRLHSGAPRRGRWVFDQHDVRELLGGKKDLLALVVGGGSASAYDGTPLSWSVYAWRQGSGPTGKLDLKRRRELQGPRQSLTAALITYNSEGMLIRCLKSIQPYVDEIVVNDNGSTDGTLDILAQFGARVFPGLDPRTHGFDASRNAGLPHFTGDFVLWIDTDEELVDGFGLPKYLRWNMFNGYGIQQHHFSANPPNAFKPDLPVRVFRRVGLDGKPTGIRWFGIVHEHPELAVNASVGESVCLSDVNIAHVGYLSESVRRRRFDRNIQLMFRDRAMYPDRLLGKLLMIRDYAHLARYAVQAGGGMTRESAEFYEKVVAEYRQAFLGRAHSMALDGLQYYNEALTALGRGFEVNIVLQIGWIEGGSRDVNYRGRVADLADLQTLLAGCAKDLGGIWSEKYL